MREEVRFADGDRASLVRARVDEGADDLVHTLGLEARKGNPVILVCGGADELRAEPMAVAQELPRPSYRRRNSRALQWSTGEPPRA